MEKCMTSHLYDVLVYRHSNGYANIPVCSPINAHLLTFAIELAFCFSCRQYIHLIMKFNYSKLDQEK